MVEGPEDLQTLSNTFNLMTGHIKQQRDDLVSANEAVDARRRFTEAMLAGVSAGVIGIDPSGHVSLVNRSALLLLGLNESDLLGKPAEEALPAFMPVFEQALTRPSGFAEAQVDIERKGESRSLFARVTTETSDDTAHGHVLTFDDITDLVSAQRNSAWADIARRIAHEIKNPLTPIQLSAERLKRKYGNQIQTDKHVFDQCTDTIIRQVGDIGRMVDEFSSFARMPKAVPEPQELASIVREATVLQRVSSSDIDIELDVREWRVRVSLRPPPHHAGDHQSRQERARVDRGAAARSGRAARPHRGAGGHATTDIPSSVSPTMASACRARTATGWRNPT